MKKTAFVVANCQVRALEAALALSENFGSYFDFVQLPPVHVIKADAVERLHDTLPSAGLLLAQFVSETYRNNIGLGLQTLKGIMPSSGVSISWPSIYWSGYNPELFYFKDEKGASFTEAFDYHHRVIFGAYIQGRSADDVANNLLSADEFSATSEIAIRGLDELAKRESALDIKVAPFIRENYRTERLFWTFNHPTQSVILDVARQVLSTLGIRDDLPKKAPKEILNSTVYPILPSVKSALGLDFGTDSKIVVRGAELGLLDTVTRYYSLYDKHQTLVEHNRHVVEK